MGVLYNTPSTQGLVEKPRFWAGLFALMFARWTLDRAKTDDTAEQHAPYIRSSKGKDSPTAVIPQR